MIELGAGHFTELCASQTVRERLGAVETERGAAVRKFWIRGTVGLALAVAALLTLINAGSEVVAFIAFLLILIGTIFAAGKPLMDVSEGLKHPKLDELARRCGMEYLPSGFDPPVYGRAQGILFGRLSSQTFTDLIHGADEEGRGYAVYEACLQRSSGKNTHTVFSGQVYAIHRRPRSAGGGITAIVPDRKIFNFFKPASDMARVRIEGDEEFERRFEVYSTAPMEAKQLLFSSELRRHLLELRKTGAVSVFVSPEEAMVGVNSSKNRFEPSSMLRNRAPEERVQLMFDDVAASLETLRALRAELG
jgi:hypothetical protein